MSHEPFSLSLWIEDQFRRRPLRSWSVVGVVLVLFLLWLLRPDVVPYEGFYGQSEKELQQRADKLLNYVITTLEQCEQYELEHVTTRVVERLNQWLEFQRPSGSWKLHPVITTAVPQQMQQQLGFDQLDKMRFQHHEGIILLETVWLRWISDQVAQEHTSPLEVAQALFDWTVRNIQLEDIGRKEVRELVWQTLLFGRGHPLNRVWTFMLLARQQGMEVVLLAFPGKKGQPPRPWIPALYLDGELYLFDHMLGLPIPGPDGQGVATLTQAVENPQVLRQLDIPGRFTYPVHSEELKNLVALFEASPHFLSRRMRVLEEHLSGSHRLALTIVPEYIAQQVGRCRYISQVRPWIWPYECRVRQATLTPEQRAAEARKLMPFLQVVGVRIKDKRGADLQKALAKAGWKFLQQSEEDQSTEQKSQKAAEQIEIVHRPLWKARIMHFRGQLSGEQGAVHHYQLVRMPEQELERLRRQQIEPMKHQLQTLANDPRVDPQQLQHLQAQAQQALSHWKALLQAKQDATYWLGLAAYDRKDYETAIEYFRDRVLGRKDYRRWQDGARYNLARAYEAAGRYQEAIAAYNQDTSLQRHGSVLRALRLQRRLAQARSPHKNRNSDGAIHPHSGPN